MPYFGLTGGDYIERFIKKICPMGFFHGLKI